MAKEKPRDVAPSPAFRLGVGGGVFGQAIEWARRAIAVGPDYWASHWYLVAALALRDHEQQAHEALRRYLPLPYPAPKTITVMKGQRTQVVNEHTDPRYVEYWDRLIEGLRKAGMPEA